MQECWEPNAWAPNAWAEGAWCSGVQPCTPAPIGTSWASNSWSIVAWCQNTWKDLPTPPTPPSPVRVEARRWPGPSIVIYDEEKEINKIKKKIREDEEIIIL